MNKRGKKKKKTIIIVLIRENMGFTRARDIIIRLTVLIMYNRICKEFHYSYVLNISLLLRWKLWNS